MTSCSDNSEVKSDDPIVKCFNGSFIGYVEDNGVLTFKGIPFAKAPIGELRWKAPQPVEASKEVFEAKEYGLPGLQSYDEGEVASHGGVHCRRAFVCPSLFGDFFQRMTDVRRGYLTSKRCVATLFSVVRRRK